MEGKDILSKVASLNEEKKKKEKALEDKKDKKNDEKEIFYKCKLKCSCRETCPARFLKECPNFHSILRSVCSKMACRKDNKRPTMILPASVLSRRKLYFPFSENNAKHKCNLKLLCSLVLMYILVVGIKKKNCCSLETSIIS